MWFRLSVGGSSSEANDDATAIATANTTATKTNTNNNNTNETSKFEKFRRASFRRKSSIQQTPSTRKRSKSPHYILQKTKSSSLEEAPNEDEVDEGIEKTMNNINANGEIYKSEVNILLDLPTSKAANKKAIETKVANKKPTIKTIKTEPPKRKFYKTFATATMRRQNSDESNKATTVPNDLLSKSIDSSKSHVEQIDDLSFDTDSDTDSSVDEDDNATRKKQDNLPRIHGKEKILLTDPKYKHNRIEKSASKTKIAEIEKRESIKRSRSARKVTAASLLAEEKNNKKDKKEKSIRAHANLNLQALVKFVVNNKKFLNGDDFTLMRRKSISEAASSVFAVAASCKPLPIALKYSSQDRVVAEAPKENDAKAERNVILMKKQSLKNSFRDRLGSGNSNDNNIVNNAPDSKEPVKQRTKSIDKISKIKRNSSNSSKSSGNFEDEAFYSCDEQDDEITKGDKQLSQTIAAAQSLVEVQKEQEKQKSSSPSLTSRVAAKINETTNNYKNRKAAAAANKTAKKRKNSNKRPEFYKQISIERLHSTSIVRQPSDRRPDAGNISLRSNGNTSHNSSDLQSSFHATTADTSGVETSSGAGASGGIGNVGGATAAGAATGADVNAQDAAEGKDARRERLHQQHQQNKSAPVSVNRSESYKERLSHKRNRNSRRKTSDPSLTSRPNDEQTDVGLSNSNYTASSNSSLSSGGGSESPSTSMEQVGGAGTTTAQTTHSHHPHHMHQHSHQDSFHGSIGGGSSNASFWGGSIGGPGGPTIGQLARQWNFESDDEDDLIEVDWSSNVTADVLSALADAEKKRQEIINEIYQTERSHVRTLKLLDRLFFCPLQESGVLSNDHLMLLFPPALPALRDMHSNFEQKLKQRRVEHNHVVSHVGDLLAGMFDGHSGEELREYAANFCARQQIALEALKEKRRKDEQLQKILSKAESHKACRRLQLKDLLPTVLQRLTKYPLLFENLYKVTIRVVPENATEADAIQRALESSKKILVDVNQAVKTAEDAHKLQNIQRKLDKSFDKDEFKNLDLTQYRLIHDGSLTMKKNPSIQLHGLLFDSMIVLLTKQDDKYSLKYLHAARNTEVNNKPVRPIMNIDSETLVRQEAADKNSFFLIKTRTSQMLELRAPSSSECKTWFKHISDAAEQYKPRSKNANHEPVDDPAIATLPHSNTKESLELTPERPPPIAATATVTTTPLAPMMPPPAASMVSTMHSSHNTNNNDVQLRQTGKGIRVECTLTPTDNSAIAHHKQRLSHNELSPNASSVNRTMSTRSCGEANNNYGVDNANGVTLRHTQSARQANAADGADHNNTGLTVNGGPTKRDSASIVYSNNSNNTRTLMQSSPPLVEPTAIQISISPAHTAEPVLTPAERLRRLDVAIRDGLLEKQKIICDMFRLPVEHFHEIVDIAAMPEAPKDSSDIALAAYAQVQSLTEVLNDYMHVTPEQEISAVSTAVCDQCHEKQQRQRHATSPSATSTSSSTCSSNSASTTTLVATAATQQQSPPPLPPPNKQSAQAQQQTPAPMVTKLHTPALLDANIHEDDDGYCKIDELRLPAVTPVLSANNKAKASSPPPPLPPPAGTFKTPPPPPPPPNAKTSNATAATTQNTAQTTTVASTPELVKRQSTISADSIPEESADEVTKALDDEFTPIGGTQSETSTPIKEKNTSLKEKLNKNENEKNIEDEQYNSTTDNTGDNKKDVGESQQDSTETLKENEISEDDTIVDNDAKNVTANENPELQGEDGNAKEERSNTEISIKEKEEVHMEAKDCNAEKSTEQNEVDQALATLSKLSSALNMVDSMTQTLPILQTNAVAATVANGNASLCGRNRIQHANSLEPSVPCHALNSIVSALNAQISLLLPKINERDMERERLRKENQHLRELLNAMHERQRVEAKLDTPNNITISADADEEMEGTLIVPLAPFNEGPQLDTSSEAAN
ncbi:uncharacterized protein LOC119679413 [Teleopsis dalmanni]|uniref:uncharacterized protein LOC119679413 n=1 Tax=Teleopsis dalmanni TaxID=139649 RepID=UPI0018CF300C|nr:uncharacterized protein LOC119679413 [Teleopsis dalmanni]